MGILDGINIIPGDPNFQKRKDQFIARQNPSKTKQPRKKVVPELQNYPVLEGVQLAVYTDGSVYTLSESYCENNGIDTIHANKTFHGSAFVVWNHITGEILHEFSKGFEYNQGRQAGEVLAIYFALKYLSDNYQNHSTCLFSDSEYALKAIGPTWIKAGWMAKWKENGWKNYEGSPVKYRDHFQAMEQFIESLNYGEAATLDKCVSKINLYHVKGHHEDIRNCYVDELAGKARREYQKETVGPFDKD